MVNTESFLEEEINSELDFNRKPGHVSNRKNALGKGQKWISFKYSVINNDNYTLPL